MNVQKVNILSPVFKGQTNKMEVHPNLIQDAKKNQKMLLDSLKALGLINGACISDNGTHTQTEQAFQAIANLEQDLNGIKTTLEANGFKNYHYTKSSNDDVYIGTMKKGGFPTSYYLGGTVTRLKDGGASSVYNDGTQKEVNKDGKIVYIYTKTKETSPRNCVYDVEQIAQFYDNGTPEYYCVDKGKGCYNFYRLYPSGYLQSVNSKEYSEYEEVLPRYSYTPDDLKRDVIAQHANLKIVE